jgi:hypothetical protein
LEKDVNPAVAGWKAAHTATHKLPGTVNFSFLGPGSWPQCWSVNVPNAGSVNGIDCLSVGNCVAVGENATEQGIVGTLVAGSPGPTTVIEGTEYLYGVAFASSSAFVVAGAGPDRLS